VEHKNSSDSIFVFMDLFIPTQMLVVFNSSKRKLLYQTQVHMYISQIYIYIYIFQLNKRLQRIKLQRIKEVTI